MEPPWTQSTGRHSSPPAAHPISRIRPGTAPRAADVRGVLAASLLPQVVVDSLAEHLQRHPPGASGLTLTKGAGAGSASPVLRGARLFGPRSLSRDGVSRPATLLYASLLFRPGAGVKTIQRRLGHATATATLDIYAQLWPDSEVRARGGSKPDAAQHCSTPPATD
jgi:hypothetical protein